MGFVVKVVADLTGIVVQEVNGLAHLGDGVAEGFTRLAHQNANQLLHLIFHQHRSTFEDRGALLRRSGEPDRRVVHRAVEGQIHFLFGRFPGKADDIFRLGRVDHRLHFASDNRLLEDRSGLPFLQGAVQQRRGERCQAVFVRQVQTGGVDAPVAVQLARQGNLRMRQAHLTFLGSHFLDGLHRIRHQLVQRQGGIGDAVHEGGVSPVLQQTTHQVGQQGFMGADRGVDTAWTVQFAIRHFTGDLLVQRFTHAVQALEFVLARIVVLTGQLVDSR